MWYEGGKFIATTERAKSSATKKKVTGRVEIEPYVWVDGREGFRPLLGFLCIEIYNREMKTFAFNSNLKREFADPEYAKVRKSRVDLWNAGERWVAK